MDTGSRLNNINYLLGVALDSEEEYIYHGEMSDYANTYAADAESELRSLFIASKPTPAEIDLCVEAICDPERIKNGRSKELLLGLREVSKHILDALAASPDPKMRIFALETCKASTNPLFYSPLYGTIGLERGLLNDPDENVRCAALSSVQQTLFHNASYLESSLQRGVNNPLLDLLFQSTTCLDDPSPAVRAQAAQTLIRWVGEVREETVQLFLDRGNNPAVGRILAKSGSYSDRTIRSDIEPKDPRP